MADLETPEPIPTVLEAARALCERMEEIRDSEAFKSVFVMAHIHGMPYNGPEFGVELTNLRRALDAEALMETSNGH